MRAGQGRGLESVILSARQRAAALLESVASGRLSPDQALGLWPDGRGDDPEVEAARSALRRRAASASLVAAARALRAERSRGTPGGHRPPSGALWGLGALPGGGAALHARGWIALTVGAALLVSALWLLVWR